MRLPKWLKRRRKRRLELYTNHDPDTAEELEWTASAGEMIAGYIWYTNGSIVVNTQGYHTIGTDPAPDPPSEAEQGWHRYLVRELINETKGVRI